MSARVRGARIRTHGRADVGDRPHRDAGPSRRRRGEESRWPRTAAAGSGSAERPPPRASAPRPKQAPRSRSLRHLLRTSNRSQAVCARRSSFARSGSVLTPAAPSSHTEHRFSPAPLRKAGRRLRRGRVAPLRRVRTRPWPVVDQLPVVEQLRIGSGKRGSDLRASGRSLAAAASVAFA
jgi:hypothetical protein